MDLIILQAILYMVIFSMKGKKILFILPCAGGNSYSYMNWLKYLKMDTVLLDYAGHWIRWDEKLNFTYEELIEDMFSKVMEISGLEEYDIYFFGHSMGAMVCWDIINKLLSLRNLTVKALFVASMWSPEDLNENKRLQMTEAELKDFLLKIRQVPHNMFSNDFFMEKIFPAICNDFEIFSKKSRAMNNCMPIDVPIYCITGSQDSLVDFSLINKWHKYSLDKCNCWERPGNHFFLNEKDNVEWICKLINKISGCDCYEK